MNKADKTITGKRGKVYLIGAGPGDPTLITVKGQRFLEKAEVVIYDYLASKKLLKLAPENAEFIYAGKKGGGHHAHTQEEINNILIEKAKAGKTVIRLKGGDPFIFGRGGEEIEELVEAGIPFEVVPGVTSATAAATYAGVPITHRQFTTSVAFITGHEDPKKRSSTIDWSKIATGIGTLVFYMGIKNLPMIVEKLLKNGRDPQTPAMVVRWASTPEQHSVEGCLKDIPELVKKEDIRPPALVVVGEVVSLRPKMNWFEKRPLFGKKIMVTRTRDQASELVSGLEEEGAACIEFPTIAIAPPDSWDDLDNAIDIMDQYHWVLFTSINAIQCFFSRLSEKNLDARALKGVRIGVVGSATATCLESYGLRADLLPEEFTGEGLGESLIETGVDNQNILIPRALKAREVLPEMLRSAGADVTVVPVYQNIRPEGQTRKLRQYFEEKEVNIITFTSSSTVRNFFHMLGAGSEEEAKRIISGVHLASIGPITSKTILKSGCSVDIQPETYTIPSLIESIISFYH